MFYFLLILGILFSMGYTYYKINQLKRRLGQLLKGLEEGLRNIISGEEPLFGEKFESQLREAIKGAVADTFGFNYKVLDNIDEVNLLVRIRWGQEEDMTMFDFSHWGNEGETDIVGVDIWTKMKEPESLKNAEIEMFTDGDVPALMYPNAELLYVKNKDEETDDNAFWMWPEQEIFLSILQSGDYEMFED